MYRLGSQREKGYDHLFYLNFQIMQSHPMDDDGVVISVPPKGLTLRFLMSTGEEKSENRASGESRMTLTQGTMRIVHICPRIFAGDIDGVHAPSPTPLARYKSRTSYTVLGYCISIKTSIGLPLSSLLQYMSSLPICLLT